jgi:hypothetical protein
VYCLVFSVPLFPAAAEQPRAETDSAVAVLFDSPVDVQKLRRHIEFLAAEELKGRSGAGARIAADYIRDHFKKLGLQPLFEDGSYFQKIPGKSDENGDKQVVGRNVAGWIPGSDPKLVDEFVIVSAHYDHLGVRNGQVYRGADDNASGVSMMLEVARHLAAMEKKPRRSVVFVGFDLEERLLWGSRWFAAHSPWPIEKVKLFITADMIGRSLGDLPLPTVFVLGSEHAPSLSKTLDRVGRPRGLEVARLGIDLVGTRSDYGPFRARKIPFLFFSTGEHPDYHTPRDVPERIDYEKVARVSGLVLRVTNDVANADDAPRWTDKPERNLDEARALNRIATLLLDADKQKPLTDVQRLIVIQTKTSTDRILKRGAMTASERTWLTRLAQLMLLSVF